MIVMVIIALCLFGLTLRAFLVMVGFYKTPLLSSFQHYGEEKVISPVLTFVLWGTACISFLLIFVVNLTSWMFIILVGGALGSVVYERRKVFLRRFSNLFLRYPGWYYRLHSRTSREERRRVAYMWLFLPERTRMVYNTHDGFFNKWVDLVLMTVTE
ncbi:MAG: hypothetical protein ACPG7F_13965 [Aggregatilineales bacterium]